MGENCYFFTEKRQDGEEYMTARCVPCHEKNQKQPGWFWPGELKGYGPYDIICTSCGKKIHSTESNKCE